MRRPRTNGYASDIHRKKPKGTPKSERTARANGPRSKIRHFVEHVFAHQKSRLGCLCGLSAHRPARTKTGLVNLAYNPTRYVGQLR